MYFITDDLITVIIITELIRVSLSLCQSMLGDRILLVVRQLVAVSSLKTEAASREGFQVQRQLALGARGLRGGAGGVVRVRVQGGGQVVHTEGLSQLGVHQGQSRHLR